MAKVTQHENRFLQPLLARFARAYGASGVYGIPCFSRILQAQLTEKLWPWKKQIPARAYRSASAYGAPVFQTPSG